MMKKTIAYYITPHGYGHAVRSLEVISHLLRSDGGSEVILVSDFPEFLVEQNVGRPIPVRRRRIDVGLVQRDSIQFDLVATRGALEELRSRHEDILTEEARFLKEGSVDAIVADVPFLAFYAASRIGIPGIGLGNFTWDWIYQAYANLEPGWDGIIEWIREGYRRCDLFLQLPMHGDCSVCPRIRDVPLVARKAVRSREEVRSMLGCRPEEKVYLISFAALDLDEKAQERIEAIDGATFLFKRPLSFRFGNGVSLDDVGLPYVDVVAAADAVITKPGYGIVSDCLAHGTPIIYTDRGFFPEYEILVREMEKHVTTVYMPSQDLYSGAWERYIQRMETSPRRSGRVRADGARVCAQSILALLD